MRAWILIALTVAGCADAEPRGCKELVAAQHWKDALASCRRELAAQWTAETAIRGATAAYYLDLVDEVDELAGSVVVGPRLADAQYLLGANALGRRDLDTAQRLLSLALIQHVA